MPAMQAPVQAFERLGSAGMLCDIWDTPKVLKQLLEKHLKAGGVEIAGLRDKLPDSHGLKGRTPLEVMAACSHGKGASCSHRKISLIGSGTSWHVSLLAEYLIEHIARIPVEVQYASEFRYRQPLLQPGDILIVVSNSGETTDAVESLRKVRRSPNGESVLIIAVVNEVESTLARESDVAINVSAGSEVGVASTKGFSAASMIFALLAAALGQETGTFVAAEQGVFLDHIKAIPDKVQTVLDRESKSLKREGTADKPLEIGECALWDIACQNALAQNVIFLGRGFNFPIALEGAMKCKELAYIHAEGYPAAEMKHGPIALIDQFMPVVVICPKADTGYEKIKANIEEVKARSGAVIAITEETNTELQAPLCEHVIYVPETHEYLMPLLCVIPLQLLGYMMGVLRGNEVDNPRGLIKSVSTKMGSPRGKGSGYPS
ncbi:unnamed protein product [Polarella glacialis]|uniref:SIS domain-containing protein n=1 Tax=Polarella glacialis TaxID=89957 RepID=A0A813L4U9_POLGL|nr:unnamed protein product [Polarella glacialis]